MEADVSKYYSQPELLAEVSVSELEACVKKFPFHALAQMLLAKKYQQVHHPNFHEQLHRAALSVHNRELLYSFMNGDSSKSNLPSQADAEQRGDETSGLEQISHAASELAISELTEENADEFDRSASEEDAINLIEELGLEQAEREERDDMLLMNERAGGGAEFLPTEFINMESSDGELVLEQDAEIQSLTVIEEEFVARESEFDQQQLELIVVSNAEHEELIYSDDPQEAIHDVGEAAIEAEVELEQRLHDRDSISNGDDRKEDDFRINETVSAPGEFLPEKSYRFSDWLRFFRLSQPPPQVPTSEKKKKTSQSEVEEDEDEIPANLHMQAELESIDKVVSAMHHEVKQQEEPISAEELAKKSTQMDDDIVSETLAKILEEQGHYDKAIRMYVKLSLRIPDKVSFFAARIKELKAKK